MRLTLATPCDFDFRSAVCSHGFFVLAPNLWNPDRRTLSTVVTLNDETAVPIVIGRRQGRAGADRCTLSVRCAFAMSNDQRVLVRTAVRRMLRLDEDLSAFHRRCRQSPSHRAAAAIRFGRLLRSPSLFEDVVKVICTCNVAWRQTVAMVDKIVAAWGVPTSVEDLRGFPTPERLARVRVTGLRRTARLGYRAEFVHRLARDITEGRLDLDAIEHFTGPSDALYNRLRQIHGVGDYAAAHLCMLLGRYDRLALDTELKRFLARRHPRRRLTPASIRACYDRWHPYQFLAYWFELWSDYTRRHGDADQWQPAQVGPRITSRAN